MSLYKTVSMLSPLWWAVVLAFSGCAGRVVTLEDYEVSLYRALKETSGEAYESHVRLLGMLVEQAQRNGIKPPPGICAEYAYHLARSGRYEVGKPYLAKEVEYYPESAAFVAVLKRLIEGGKRVVPVKSHMAQ